MSMSKTWRRVLSKKGFAAGMKSNKLGSLVFLLLFSAVTSSSSRGRFPALPSSPSSSDMISMISSSVVRL